MNRVDDLPAESRNMRLLAVNPDSEAAYTVFAYFDGTEASDDITPGEKVTHSSTITRSRLKTSV